MTHVFDQSIALTPAAQPHLFQGATHPAYANMVGPFGGTTCAQLLQGALQHPQRLGDPVALTVNYAGPVADGTFELTAEPLRTNRSTQHWNLLLRQQGVACASGSAVFATRRSTWGAPESLPPADMPAADAVASAPHAGRPAWVRCYDMRFPDPSGEAFHHDSQEQAHSFTRMWIRDEPPRAVDFASLAALCDAFFPRIFVRRRRFTPIATVTLSTYFHIDATALAAIGSQHLLATARAHTFRDGYFDQTGLIWAPDGQLLASSHQVVYFKD